MTAKMTGEKGVLEQCHDLEIIVLWENIFMILERLCDDFRHTDYHVLWSHVHRDHNT